MAGTPTSYRVEVLTEDNWPVLRDIRLTALKGDPAAFLSSHETEMGFDEQRWRQEFSRGEWHIMRAGDLPVGLVGVTREPGMSSQECYLEYLWVAPGARRRGIGSMLLRWILDRLRDFEVHTVWLYVLDGNESAMRLYQRFGFQSTNLVQPLPLDPQRSEEQLRLRLC